MKAIVIALAGLAGSACAEQPRTDQAPVAQPAVMAPADTTRSQQTAVDRGRVRDGDCVVVRALDGRAVCDDAVPASRTAPAENPPEAVADALSPGQYVVIGSFADQANARRWAGFNAEFGTEVQAVNEHGKPMYRVLVGPVAGDDTALLREILASVGVGRGWRLAVCAGGVPAASAADCAALGAAAGLADAGTR
jgi:hypothetical protein